MNVLEQSHGLAKRGDQGQESGDEFSTSFPPTTSPQSLYALGLLGKGGGNVMSARSFKFLHARHMPQEGRDDEGIEFT